MSFRVSPRHTAQTEGAKAARSCTTARPCARLIRVMSPPVTAIALSACTTQNDNQNVLSVVEPVGGVVALLSGMSKSAFCSAFVFCCGRSGMRVALMMAAAERLMRPTDTLLLRTWSVGACLSSCCGAGRTSGSIALYPWGCDSLGCGRFDR
ncbi:conserved hypothetical protein [Ricinus communis]|uniref:Uncharacterized protein n=1 Tax=Ricinus communis TaxID=3988 RepID=B9TLQ1_RICCO|nr:conserved hypothetical protein [Ricinus communis]